MEFGRYPMENKDALFLPAAVRPAVTVGCFVSGGGGGKDGNLAGLREAPRSDKRKLHSKFSGTAREERLIVSPYRLGASHSSRKPVEPACPDNAIFSECARIESSPFGGRANAAREDGFMRGSDVY